MGVLLNTNVKPVVKKFLDDRQKVSSLAQLRANTLVPDGFEAYCEETKKWYQYHSTNFEDSNTGKWRERPSGSGSSEESFNSRFHFCNVLPGMTASSVYAVRKTDGVIDRFINYVSPSNIYYNEPMPSGVLPYEQFPSGSKYDLYLYVDLENKAVNFVHHSKADDNDYLYDTKALLSVEELNALTNTDGIVPVYVESELPQEKHFYIAPKYYKTKGMYIVNTNQRRNIDSLPVAFFSSLDKLIINQGSQTVVIDNPPAVEESGDPSAIQEPMSLMSGNAVRSGSGQVAVDDPITPGGGLAEMLSNPAVLVRNEEATYGYDLYFIYVGYRGMSFLTKYNGKFVLTANDTFTIQSEDLNGNRYLTGETTDTLAIVMPEVLEQDLYEEYICLNDHLELIGKDVNKDFENIDNEIKKIWMSLDGINPDNLVQHFYVQYDLVSDDMESSNGYTRVNDHMVRGYLENTYDTGSGIYDFSKDFSDLWNERLILNISGPHCYSAGWQLEYIKKITVNNFQMYNEDTPATKTFYYMGSDVVFGGSDDGLSGWTVFWPVDSNNKSHDNEFYFYKNSGAIDSLEDCSIQADCITIEKIGNSIFSNFFKNIELEERLKTVEAYIASQQNNS